MFPVLTHRENRVSWSVGGERSVTLSPPPFVTIYIDKLSFGADSETDRFLVSTETTSTYFRRLKF